MLNKKDEECKKVISDKEKSNKEFIGKTGITKEELICAMLSTDPIDRAYEARFKVPVKAPKE